jgi:hypothetical protein
MSQQKLTTKAQSVVSLGLRWSSDDAEKNRVKNSFIRVGGDKASTRALSGALRSWSSADPAENETIFNCLYRISGTPENIRAALLAHNPPYDEDTINECINDSITKDNYQTTKKEEFDEEVASYKKMKEDKAPVVHYTIEQINWFASKENIGNMKIESKKAGAKGRNGEGTKTRLAPGSSIVDRIAKLQEGFILDISGMTSDFKNIKTKPIPKTNKSGKVYVPELPFLTNDYNKYYEIVNHVYKTEGLITYEKELAAIQAKLSVEKVQPIAKPLGPRIEKPETTVPSSTTTKPRSILPQPTGQSNGQVSNSAIKSPSTVKVINPVKTLAGLPKMDKY